MALGCARYGAGSGVLPSESVKFPPAASYQPNILFERILFPDIFLSVEKGWPGVYRLFKPSNNIPGKG